MAAGIRDQLGKSNYDKLSSSLLLIRAFLLGKLQERWKPGPEELQPPVRAHGRAQAGGHPAHELPRIRRQSTRMRYEPGKRGASAARGIQEELEAEGNERSTPSKKSSICIA